MAAILNGRSVGINSGHTPQSGTMMSTRAGDFDPEVLMCLLETGIKTLPEVRSMLEDDIA